MYSETNKNNILSTQYYRRWFLPRGAVLARYMLSSCVCLSVCLSVRLSVSTSQAGIVPK